MSEKSNGLTSRLDVRKLVMTAMLAAISFVLMFLEFNVPLIPTFIKMDFSEVPALIAAFTFGPISGIIVCLVKNLLHLSVSQSFGIGELSNFLLGVAYVVPAGLIYKKMKNKKGALIGSVAGATSMAIFSVITNYLIVYPLYAKFIMPMDAILGMYHAVNSGITNIIQALLVFNLPFTLVKGVLDVVIVLIVYKTLSPIIKGDRS